MKDIKEIRFLATNFSNLQGLRMVIIGVLLILVCLWGNGLKYPISIKSVLVLLLEVLVILTIYYAVDRYYLRSFGQVKATPEIQRFELKISIIGGILSLIAFWLDVTYRLPFSLIGLVCGIGLLADYIRFTWMVKGRHLLYYPIGAVLLLVVSVFPLLGLPGWWHLIGIKGQVFAIAMLLGFFSIVAGIFGHIYLTRTLSPKAEEK
ncbi:MAG TPA: hypothetical protein DIW44_09570 [Anaerolineaceae bacterium]|nr:hypothetical protein [Anaerolineaceae bacterium]